MIAKLSVVARPPTSFASVCAFSRWREEIAATSTPFILA